jgi:hypothetical protein
VQYEGSSHKKRTGYPDPNGARRARASDAGSGVCPLVKQPAAVSFWTSRAHSSTYSKQIPMALKGPTNTGAGLLCTTKVCTACRLRVEVGAQTAPAFSCTLVSPDLIIHHRAER